MLGPAKPRRLDEPIAVSLEALVPTNNFYRHLEAKLDLSFMRDWVTALYAERGRPSIDPVVFFRLQLVMFFEGIRSERKLIETASLNLAHRWYLGYALDETLPDHFSLTRIRRRLGIDEYDAPESGHHGSRPHQGGRGRVGYAQVTARSSGYSRRLPQSREPSLQALTVFSWSVGPSCQVATPVTQRHRRGRWC
jgi:hypothetical protein